MGDKPMTAEEVLRLIRAQQKRIAETGGQGGKPLDRTPEVGARDERAEEALRQIRGQDRAGATRVSDELAQEALRQLAAQDRAAAAQSRANGTSSRSAAAKPARTRPKATAVAREESHREQDHRARPAKERTRVRQEEQEQTGRTRGATQGSRGATERSRGATHGSHYAERTVEKDMAPDEGTGLWPSLSSWREALDTSKTHPPDYWLLAVVAALIVFGLVMLYSSSFVISAYEENGNSMFYLGKQLLWVVVGIAGALVTMRLDYRLWRRFSVPGMIVVLILLAAVAVLPEPIVEEINGAKRWINLGPVGLQPSQVAYLVFVVYIADWLSKRGQRLRQVAYGLVPFATIMGLLGGLIMLEPDMGTAVVLVLVGAIVFLVAGADLKQFSLAALLSGGIFFLFARFSPYRWARMTAFLDPWKDPNGVGYHLVHSQMALGSGGLLGVGLGQGRQKFYWLPSPHTDSIFAVIGEELGLIGCALVIGLFLWVAYRGYTIALHAPDRYGMLLGVGITTWVSFQAFINMAVVTGLLPFSGMTLPFISYGGSSLAACMTAVGLLLNLSCHEKRDHASADLGRGDWWTRLSSVGRRRRPAKNK